MRINLKDVNPSDADKALKATLGPEVEKLPSLNRPQPKKNIDTQNEKPKNKNKKKIKGQSERTQLSVHVPLYIRDQLRLKAAELGEPMNVLFLRAAAEKYNLKINEEDLIDGRTFR